MRRIGILFVLAATALAHNGEYRPPLPPPRIEEPGGPIGAPARGEGTGRDAHEVTPKSGGESPPDARPHAIPGPEGARPGLNHDDDRYTVEIWWEANRYRFLPTPRDLPMRDELTSILFEVVKGKSDTVRDHALLALGRVGAPAAFGRMRLALESDPIDIRTLGSFALVLLGDDTASPLLKRIAADGNASPHIRAVAVLSLGLLGGERDAAFLREILHEEWMPPVRTAAALGLGLVLTTSEESYYVAREAALALAEIDPARAAAELARRLQSESLFVRRHAASCLGMLLSHGKPGPLTEMLSRVKFLAGSGVVKLCLYVDNEYLLGLTGSF